MAKPDICIGIDLGTTNSCVGVWQDGQVHIIANDLGYNTTPSLVHYEQTGKKIVGTMAKTRLNRFPKQTIYGVKRMIGQKWQNIWLEEFNYQLEKDQQDNPQIVLPSGTRVRPEEVSAQILIKMKQTAESYLGHPVTKAVITVPAYFNDGQRTATRTAARIAGLEVVRMINEPTAACLCYGLNQKEQSMNVLVYDLGGGTLDVSLLNLNQGLFEVLATNGDCHLGGEDFDLVLTNHFIYQNSLDLTPAQKNKLKMACEDIKKQLSQTDQAYYVLDDFLSDSDLTLEITFEEWERVCSELLERCLAPVEQVLRDADLEYAEVDQIVLVGGSTRIRSVQQRLSSKFAGKPLNKSVNPDEAVAYGAAIQGAILTNMDQSGKTDQMVLVDVTPLSLGLETTGGMMSVIVSRNSSIPCEKVAYYTTIENNQEEVELKVFQGERTLTSDCRLLGTFDLSGIPPMLRGIPKIKVVFKIDADGILNVSAIEEVSQVRQEVTIRSDSTRLSEREIEQMILEAEESKDRDEQVRQLVEHQKQLLAMIEDFSRMLDDQLTQAENVENIKLEDIKLENIKLENIKLENINNLQLSLKAIKSEIQTAVKSEKLTNSEKTTILKEYEQLLKTTMTDKINYFYEHHQSETVSTSKNNNDSHISLSELNQYLEQL